LKHYETNSVNPYSFGAFQVYQECSKRHCGLGDLTMTNKTNKQPSFIKEIPTFKNKLGDCKGWIMVAKNPCKLYKYSTNTWMMLWKLSICVLLSCGYWCCDFKPSVSFQQLLKENLEFILEKIVYSSCRHHHLW